MLCFFTLLLSLGLITWRFRLLSILRDHYFLLLSSIYCMYIAQSIHPFNNIAGVSNSFSPGATSASKLPSKG